MRFATTFAALAAPLLVSAAPMKRDHPASTATAYVAASSAPPAAAAPSGVAAADLLVLKFANVLEQLETEFYTQALAKFQESDFIAAGFSSANIPVQQFKAIQLDESTHTTVLAAVLQSLGDQAISGCQFDFSTVLTDVTTMAAVARLVELVGVGAYIGAAGLITDPSILTAAATIVTVEARHQSILNVLNAGTAIPQAFDLPLTPPEVLALAGPFISGCDVGIQGLPPLTVTTTGAILPGTALSFSFDALSGVDPNTLSCQMLAGGMPISLSLPFSECIVPDGLTGPVAIYVTNDTQPLNNNARDKFTGNILAGPTIAFIDNAPEELGSLARPAIGGAAPPPAIGSTSVTTATISPADATSIIASASATASAPAATLAEQNGTPASAIQSTGPSSDGSLTVLGWSSVPASS